MFWLKFGFYVGFGLLLQCGFFYFFLLKNFYNIVGIGGFVLQWFVKQCVYCCLGQIGMVGFFVVVGFIGWVVVVGGGGVMDCYK